MKYYIYLILFSIALLSTITTNAFSQDRDYLRMKAVDNCNKIFEHGIYEINSSFDAKTYQLRLEKNLCETNYSSASTDKKRKLDLIYKTFTGTFGDSTLTISEWQKKHCERVSKEEFSSIEKTVESKKLSSEALEAWVECQELLNKDIIINQKIDDEAHFVHVDVRYIGGADHLNVGGIIIFSEGRITPEGIESSNNTISCLGNVAGQEMNTIGPNSIFNVKNQEFNMDCHRSSINELINGETFKRYPGARITIPMGEHSHVIDLKERWEPMIPRDKLNQIEYALKYLENRLTPPNYNCANCPPIYTAVYNEETTDHVQAGRVIGSRLDLKHNIPKKYHIVGINAAVKNQYDNRYYTSHDNNGFQTHYAWDDETVGIRILARDRNDQKLINAYRGQPAIVEVLFTETR